MNIELQECVQTVQRSEDAHPRPPKTNVVIGIAFISTAHNIGIAGQGGGALR